MEEILSSIRRIIADEEAEDDKPGDDPELGAAEARAEALNRDADALADAADDDDEDVLELTRMVRDSGEVVDLKSEMAASPATSRPAEESDEVEHDIEIAPVAEPAEDHDDVDEEKHDVSLSTTADRALISETAATAATGAFAKLSQAFQRTPQDVAVADAEGRTVEQFIEDMIRPMLKEWLDEHMPALVERLVEKEIQKLARRSELI
jgi:cell pole-organizing protein PopZ